MKITPILLTILMTVPQLLQAAFRENVTLYVPSEYATINDALYDLDEKSISKDVTVTILVDDGTYSIDSTIIVDHPNGRRIEIIGNVSSPSSCVLNMQNGSNCFHIKGDGIKLISGFKIVGNNKTGIGVFVDAAKASIGSNSLIIEEFDIGIDAQNCASVECPGTVVENCARYGIRALYGSYIFALSCTANNTGTGYGAILSRISAGNSSSTNNSTGYLAVHGSYIEAMNVTVNSNTTNYTPTPNSNTPYFGSYIGQ